jgi:hypothetical protein
VEDAKTGIESAFPTASRTLIDVCQPLEAKKGGMRAGKEASARAKSPVSWQLAREILLSKFIFCFFLLFSFSYSTYHGQARQHAERKGCHDSRHFVGGKAEGERRGRTPRRKKTVFVFL